MYGYNIFFLLMQFKKHYLVNIIYHLYPAGPRKRMY